MDAVEVTTILFNVLGGLGLFLTGAGVMWLASLYKSKAG